MAAAEGAVAAAEAAHVAALRVADAAEWGVIDDELLARALLPQAAESDDDDGSRAGLVDSITQATTLELSHCRLRQIDHLGGFCRLTRLRLDNNSITVMNNLASLVHLTWLDLSFNHIERISGLEALTKLTDFSLYHNRIHDVRGLATAGCRSLQYLSLGRNRLDLTAPSALLRVLADRFPALEALVLNGTVSDPAAAIEAAAVVAELTRLKYLDHKLIVASGKEGDTVGAGGVVGA